MKNRRKKTIIISIIVLLIIVTVYAIIKLIPFLTSYRFSLLCNENILVPVPKSEEQKFTSDFTRGNQFIIFRYNEKDRKRIIKSYKFNKVTKNNKNHLKIMIENFHSSLNEKQLSIFDDAITQEKLIENGNYYIVNNKSNGECHYTILVFYKNDLYYMNKIEHCHHLYKNK